MGCQLSKEDSTEQEQDFSLRSKSAIEAAGNETKEGLFRLRKPQQSSEDWNILQRVAPEIIDLKPAQEGHNYLDQQRLDALIKNSSPEFGFFEVIKTMVTEKPITLGALKNIIVLSKGEEEKTLMIRVFSVKSDSIDFEFYNRASIEDLIDELLKDSYQLDPDLKELQFLRRDPNPPQNVDYDPLLTLYKIKLTQSSATVKQATKIEISSKIPWLRELCYSTYDRKNQLIQNSKGSGKMYFARLNSAGEFMKNNSDLYSKFFLEKIKFEDKKIVTLLLASLSRNTTNSHKFLRPGLVFNYDLSSALDRKWDELKILGDALSHKKYVSYPGDYQIKQIRPGIMSMLAFCRENILLLIINTDFK